MSAPRSRWTGAGLWTLALLVATSWPSPHVPDVGEGDKVVHAALYAPLGYLIARAAPGVLRRPVQTAALWIGLAVFAALDEWHQRFIPGRSASAGDWAADVVGVALGLALAAVLSRRADRVA